jgi:hypothetical protein
MGLYVQHQVTAECVEAGCPAQCMRLHEVPFLLAPGDLRVISTLLRWGMDVCVADRCHLLFLLRGCPGDS